MGAQVTVLDVNHARLQYLDDIYQGRIVTMNSQIKKLLLFVMAVCVGLAAVPARSFAFGEAGTFYVQPEFGVYGTGQKQVNSIISFGASGGYFVMNPVDHPLGGGEGKSSGGRHPVTPWGKPTKGYKTRNKKKPSSKLIVKRRGQK